MQGPSHWSERLVTSQSRRSKGNRWRREGRSGGPRTFFFHSSVSLQRLVQRESCHSGCIPQSSVHRLFLVHDEQLDTTLLQILSIERVFSSSADIKATCSSEKIRRTHVRQPRGQRASMSCASSVASPPALHPSTGQDESTAHRENTRACFYPDSARNEGFM